MKKVGVLVLVLVGFLLITGCADFTEPTSIDGGSRIELCEKIHHGYYKDQCYFTVAVGLQDSQYCEKIQGKEGPGEVVHHPIIKSVCNKRVIESKANTELCEQDEFCLKQVARANLDERVCERILEESQKSRCSDSVFRAKAQKELDESYCKKITNQEEENACYSKLAELQNDGAFCDMISDEGKRRYCHRTYIVPETVEECGYDARRCKEKVAVMKIDPEICIDIGGDQGDICLGKVAEAKKDETICARIEFKELSLAGQPNRINECYSDVAKAKNDPTICEKVTSPDFYLQNRINNCYARSALSEEDCKKIKHKNPKGECYVRLAKLKYG